MKTEYILLVIYCLLGFLNIYCFLFQRTARKIRQYAFGTQNIQIENKFLPNWYSKFLIISHLRYIPLIWLLIVNWKFALISYLVLGFLKLILPVNDYSHIQTLKKEFCEKIDKGIASEEDSEIYNIILEVEKKTI